MNHPHDPRDPHGQHGQHGQHNPGPHNPGPLNPGPHNPDELGAHALGLLDPAQSRAVEEHLGRCPACRREWEELRGMVDLLDDVPPEAFLDGPPDADLVLRRTLRQVRSEASAQRRRRFLGGAGIAAATIGLVLAGGVVIGQQLSPAPVAAPPVAAPPAAAPPAAAPPVVAPPADAVVLAGEGGPGIAMTATVTPAAGWVRLSTNVKGIPPGEHCYIVVVSRDGSREIAGGWIVPPTGWRDGVTLDGAAAVPLDQVEEVVVENVDGKEFVTAEA